MAIIGMASREPELMPKVLVKVMVPFVAVGIVTANMMFFANVLASMTLTMVPLLATLEICSRASNRGAAETAVCPPHTSARPKTTKANARLTRFIGSYLLLYRFGAWRGTCGRL